MKQPTRKLCFGLLMPILLILAGCTDKKTIKKKFNVVYQGEFTIEDSTNVAYNEAAVLDLNTGDFGQHKADLIDFTIDSIRYYVYELNNDWELDDQIVSASFKVADANNSEDYTIGDISNLNLYSNYGEENARKLVLNNDGLAKFVNYLSKSPYKGYLKFAGSVAQAPISFKMRAKVYITFNAWIL